MTIYEFVVRQLLRHVGPCHRGMQRPRIADGGDGLLIWRVAANILNKQWRKASKLGEKLTNLHRKKKQLVTKHYTGPHNWRAVVNTVMNPRIHKRQGIS
jgi:hypothetical protein